MYFCQVFGICDKYLILIARRMQLKMKVIPEILTIRLNAIWDAYINYRIFIQVVAIKKSGFWMTCLSHLKVKIRKIINRI